MSISLHNTTIYIGYRELETTQVQVDSSPVLIAVDLYHDCDSVIVSQFMPHQKTVHKSNSVSVDLHLGQ